MSLIEDFRTALRDLAVSGWADTFAGLGVDPEADDLKPALLRPVSDRDAIALWPGFEEASPHAVRPIEPGRPADSLLFHALASPAVRTTPSSVPFGRFPTPAELDLAENVIYGIRPPTLADLRAEHAEFLLGVCVFARDYRQRDGAVHGAHADMAYARTGVARVGSLAPHWDGAARAFLPIAEGDDPFAMRTLPCRYGVYVAVLKPGDKTDFGPFKTERAGSEDDRERLFWAPVHKLFSGDDCLLGETIAVGFKTGHVNEKLRRIHLAKMGVRNGQFDTGHAAPEIDQAPFVQQADLAAFLDSDFFGEGVLGAVPKPRLVEPTTSNAGQIGAFVPSTREHGLGPTFMIAADSIPGERQTVRRAPEYVHVRTMLTDAGDERYLGDEADVLDIVSAGDFGGVQPYRASHYSDFTADGWIAPELTGLSGDLPRRIPAYSIVAAPDFYPFVNQSELMEWTIRDLPSAVRSRVWGGNLPLALSDMRIPPNTSLNAFGADFREEDVTATAIVGSVSSARRAVSASSSAKIARVSYLPDGAAGRFAPGWDTSIDELPSGGGLQLAAYGLGSPFPEDAKLCAAISAFWPAASPDTSRTYGWRRGWKVVAPMTDSEIGLEDAPPWDGVVGAREVVDGGVAVIENEDFDHVDYVRTALDGAFTLAETSKASQQDYQLRILAHFLAADIVENQPGGGRARIASFRAAPADDPDRRQVEAAFFPLNGLVYRFVMVEAGPARKIARQQNGRTHWFQQAPIRRRWTVLVDGGQQAFLRDGAGAWQAASPSA